MNWHRDKCKKDTVWKSTRIQVPHASFDRSHKRVAHRATTSKPKFVSYPHDMPQERNRADRLWATFAIYPPLQVINFLWSSLSIINQAVKFLSRVRAHPPAKTASNSVLANFVWFENYNFPPTSEKLFMCGTKLTNLWLDMHGSGTKTFYVPIVSRIELNSQCNSQLRDF